MQSGQEIVKPTVVGDNFGVDLSENQQARIGHRLGEIRQSRNISQAEAAKRIGVSRSHLSNIEVGRSRPGWDRLMAMATVYSVPIDTVIREVSERGDVPLPARPKRRQKVLRKVVAAHKGRISGPQKELLIAGQITAQSSMQGSILPPLTRWETYVIEGVAKLAAADRRRIFALLMEQIRASLEA